MLNVYQQILSLVKETNLSVHDKFKCKFSVKKYLNLYLIYDSDFNMIIYN